MEFELKKNDSTNAPVYAAPFHNEQCNYIISINNSSYPVFAEYNIRDFKDDNVISINYWTHVALIDKTTGELLLYTGLENSLVDIVSFKHYYLLICDTSLIFYDKKYFYPLTRKVMPDYILDYEVLNDHEIKLKYAVDGECIYKV